MHSTDNEKIFLSVETISFGSVYVINVLLAAIFFGLLFPSLVICLRDSFIVLKKSYLFSFFCLSLVFFFRHSNVTTVNENWSTGLMRTETEETNIESNNRK